MKHIPFVTSLLLAAALVVACGEDPSPGADTSVDTVEDAGGGPDADAGPADVPGEDAPTSEVPLEDVSAPDVPTPDAGPDGSDSDAGDAAEDADADADVEEVGDCCETTEAPGCEDEAIEACVCEVEPSCCEEAWDETCATIGRAECQSGCGDPASGCGDGTCAPAEDCETCPWDCGFCPAEGDCCEARKAPGCADAGVQDCVCGGDTYCCEVTWDGTCVEAAVEECAAPCEVAPAVCGDGSCAPDEDCLGCPDDCGACGEPGECCASADQPGCSAPVVETCVCDMDPFCCTSAWDGYCTAEAADFCGADCPEPVCGDGACTPGETCDGCPGDCGACPPAPCCEAHGYLGCDDPAVEACVCDADAYCCDTAWDSICVGIASDTCEAGCQGTAPCAALEIVALDAWAQALPDAAVSLGGEPSGAVSLCEEASLALSVTAPHHDPFHATVTWDGSGKASGLEVIQEGSAQSGLLVTTRLEASEGGPSVRHFTVWAGLPHRWFATSGRPARRGNHVTLLRDGEEAWATVWADLTVAADLVTASSWWWTSEMEMVRDPDVHAWLSQEERWKNTVLGALEALSGVQRKVLVGQFYDQDGLLSWATVDDELIDKAETPADDFEFMGQANESHGTFQVAPEPVDFAGRVAAAFAGGDGQIVQADDLPPFMAPVDVDMSELPLGLGYFDIPVASWHQKFLTIDGDVAFVGGMNFKTTDWDTSSHGVFEWRRMAFDATVDERLDVKAKQAEPDFIPRKDYMVRIQGPSAVDVVDVFAGRWRGQLDSDAKYADLSTDLEVPAAAPPEPDGVQAQVLTTMPAPYDEHGVLEALLRAVSNAEHTILIEDQYFRAPLLYDRIAARMEEEPELVLAVVTNPVNEWVDPGCWQTYLAHERFATEFPDRFRVYTARSFAWRTLDCTFCIDETDGVFQTMSLHSKLVFVDDVWLLAGSANSNNRGHLYEGEMSVAVFAPDWVTEAREAVLQNLLGAGWAPGLHGQALLATLDAAAEANQAVWSKWDAEGFDLDLDGAPVDPSWIPEGFLYPVDFGPPEDCFVEGVGPDVM
ncbi:MAG: hypothetical protein ACQEXJ_10025 [Myxococcota bacterium]